MRGSSSSVRVSVCSACLCSPSAGFDSYRCQFRPCCRENLRFRCLERHRKALPRRPPLLHLHLLRTEPMPFLQSRLSPRRPPSLACSLNASDHLPNAPHLSAMPVQAGEQDRRATPECITLIPSWRAQIARNGRLATRQAQSQVFGPAALVDLGISSIMQHDGRLTSTSQKEEPSIMTATGPG